MTCLRLELTGAPVFLTGSRTPTTQGFLQIDGGVGGPAG